MRESLITQLNGVQNVLGQVFWEWKVLISHFIVLINLLSYFAFFSHFISTKDPGQQPFSFQCGVGQVIAGEQFRGQSHKNHENQWLISVDSVYETSTSEVCN